MKNFIINTLTKVFAAMLSQQRIRRLLGDLIQENVQKALLDQTTVKSSFDNLIQENLQKTLEKPENQQLLWRITNLRPYNIEHHWSSIPNSIREHRMIIASREAVEFVHQNIPHLEGKLNAYETLNFALEEVTIENGLYTEFGVFSGSTINHIAKKIGSDKVVHGFDSFEGLPEDWGSAPKGTFDTDGTIPEVDDNVVLHKGWFDETIGTFLDNNPGPMAFIHADADLYSSTQTILTMLKQRIVKGTIIVFDEYINYPYWKDHEYKAFMEFINDTSLAYEYIAYTDRGYSVAVKIL